MVNSDGQIVAESVVQDYMYRGDVMREWNVYRFVADSYEREQREASASQVPYSPNHPHKKKLVRAIRMPNHNCIPNFTGIPLPRADLHETRAIYCASMLTLFKPWRSFADLKLSNQSWEQAYHTFISGASQFVRDTIENIQYQYRAQDAADADRRSALAESGSHPQVDENDDEGMDIDEVETTRYDVPQDIESELERIRRGRMTDNERLYALEAVGVGHVQGVFTPETVAPLSHLATTSTQDEAKRLKEWRSIIEAQAKADPELFNPTVNHKPTPKDPNVVPITEATIDDRCQTELVPAAEALQAAPINELREDQRRAYDIITSHLEDSLLAKRPPQLLMQIQGEGGTGKSKVIQTVTKFFETRGVKHTLRKMAFTGIAASVIEGSTTHTAAKISHNGQQSMSDRKKKMLVDEWKHVEYIIIDEISMIDRQFFAQLSRNVALAKNNSGGDEVETPFGGVNVIICGDFHQFPPVTTKHNGALYRPNDAHLSPDRKSVV